MQDGLDITFAHRSFQEYFTACFISGLDDIEARSTLISSYLGGRGRNIIYLLSELNPLLIEREVLIPTIENIEREINYKGKLNVAIYKKFIQNKMILDLLDGDIKVLPKKDSWSKNNVRIAEVFYLAFLFYKENKDQEDSMLIDSSFVLKFFSKHKNEEITEKEILENPKAIKYLEKLDWMFNMDNLRFILDLKEKLIEKHRRIDDARIENLLKGLIKVKP